MSFQYILYITKIINDNYIIAKNHKGCHYLLTKKIGYLSLAALFTNSVSAIEAGDIQDTPLSCPSGIGYNCLLGPMNEMDSTRNINFATALPSRTFDYDPSLLPEIAEVIFVLRIKHVNIGEDFVINLSGNYLLRFTKDQILIFDMYTKNSDVYQLQSANPNITIGLGISKGLPSNYKSIVIKEDAHGKLYDYAALYSENISTDETMLSETLSHPFYQIAGKDGVENNVKVPKAMAFYHTVPSHSRHARCVKSSTSTFSQLQDILWGSGTGLCGPKANSGILSANHQPAEEMKLQEKLVEADFNHIKHKFAMGFRLRKVIDLNGQNAVAFLASSLHCGEDIMERLKSRREKRAPGKQQCLGWTTRLVQLFMSLGLRFRNINQIIRNLVANRRIDPEFFPNGEYPANSEADRQALEESISADRTGATRALHEAAVQVGEAAAASGFRNDVWNMVDVQQTIAEGKVADYEVTKKTFTRLPNEVSRINDIGEEWVVEELHYKTDTVNLAHWDTEAKEKINDYILILMRWEKIFKKMMENANDKDKKQLEQALNILKTIILYLGGIRPGLSGDEDNGDLLVNTVTIGDVLVGISIGRLRGRVYQTIIQLLSPQSLLRSPGAMRGALSYLESEVVIELFSRNQIDTARLVIIIQQGVAYPADVIFHSEL